MVKNHKIMKIIITLSKDINVDNKIKKSALQIIKNINSRGHKSKGQFSITNLNLADSSLQF